MEANMFTYVALMALAAPIAATLWLHQRERLRLRRAAAPVRAQHRRPY